jgi:photosystem II stability/assembly factor-like uncharacterized protein
MPCTQLTHGCAALPVCAGFLLGTRQTLLETFDGGNTWQQRDIDAARDEGFNYRWGQQRAVLQGRSCGSGRGGQFWWQN